MFAGGAAQHAENWQHWDSTPFPHGLVLLQVMNVNIFAVTPQIMYINKKVNYGIVVLF